MGQRHSFPVNLVSCVPVCLASIITSYLLAGKNGVKNGPASIQESQLPDVLNQLVSEFSRFMRVQKETSDQFSQFSDKTMKKVRDDTTTQTQVKMASFKT